jgi:hypothetical protein
VKAMTETQSTELEIAKKKAHSFQGNTSHMNCVGATESKDGRIRMFFRDSNGEYWFTTHFKVGDKIISEEEHVFGRKIQKQRYIRRGGNY